MKKGIILGAFAFILLTFFFPVLFGKVPFPGDFLLSHYEPYRSFSYEGFAPGAIPSKNQGADVVRELYPWKHFAIEQVKRGVFPFWNPYVFAGNPSFANLQSGLLYPANVVFFIFPFNAGWTSYIILQYAFLLFFTYAYLRTIKVNVIGSIFGALAFSFSGFLIVWGEYGNFGHALCWLPLALLCIEKFIEKNKFRWGFLLFLSILLSIFAGYVQITMYILIFTSLYSAARIFALKLGVQTFLKVLLFMVFPIFISAVNLLPLLEFTKLSLRIPYTFAQLSDRLNSPLNIITLLIPDFFGNPAKLNYFAKGSILEQAIFIGTWPLFFAFYALFIKRNFYKSFFAGASILIYISTLAILPVIFLQSIGIPFLSTGVPTRILSIFCFCIAVLGAIGFSEFSKSPNNKTFIKVASVFAFLYFLLFITTFINSSPNSIISRRNILLPMLVFFAGSVILIFPLFIKRFNHLNISKKYLYILPIIIIFIITIFELSYSFNKFNSFVSPTYIYPPNPVITQLLKIQGIDRYWGYGSAEVDPNLQIINKNYTPEGYDALYPKRYGQFINGSKNGKLEKNIEQTQALIYPGFGPSDLKNNLYRQRALDILGVKYVLNKKAENVIDSAFDEKIYKLIWQKSDYQIYENKNVLPRIYIFGKYKVIEDPQSAISTIYSKNFEFKEEVILENILPPEFNIGVDKDATISAIIYDSNKISFSTSSKTDSLLFISDNYYPGWKAIVDGKNVPVINANYAFRAIPIHAGKHKVVMYYKSDVFTLGLIISSASLLLMTAYGFILIRRHEF